MKVFYFLFFITLLLSPLLSSNFIFKHAHENLSDYNFFEKPFRDHIPKNNVVPYTIASPLFSDYAEKLRFISVPEGSKISFDNENNFIYPINTFLIKTFFYYHDISDINSNRRLIETRILKNTSAGWIALPYIWNEEQTDAVLNLAGGRMRVSWVHYDGNPLEVLYSVPNMNQCKNCHTLNNIQQPIGPKIRNLNLDFIYSDGIQNQLTKWVSISILDSLPKLEILPRTVNYNNEKDGTINERARAWLDINCAHCHSKGRPAETSGLYLNYEEKNETAIGIFKPPIAAGRGSGGLQYNIVPGHPEESILEFRISSTDPGIMMPELNRKLIHKEGVELIQDWIRGMDSQ